MNESKFIAQETLKEEVFLNLQMWTSKKWDSGLAATLDTDITARMKSRPGT